MNIIFDSVKRKNLYQRILKSATFADSTEYVNSGILRVHSKLKYRKSWNEYFLPLLRNDFFVDEISNRDTVVFLIQEIDYILNNKVLSENTNIKFNDQGLVISDNLFHERNRKQENRLVRQLIRYFKRLRKNLQRHLETFN